VASPRGRKTVTVVPWTPDWVWLSMAMEPSCFSMMPLLTQRPRPVPFSPLVVKKGWKSLGRVSGSTPEPWSETVTTTPAGLVAVAG